MIILAVLVTFFTAVVTWVIGVVVALLAMALFKIFGSGVAPLKAWGIGALSVAVMTAALVSRSHSAWGYAAGAAEAGEVVFGVVACLLLVVIGLSKAGLMRLFRRTSKPPAVIETPVPGRHDD